jgi:tetratricopeptide (TPR) repeat protein
MADSSNNKRMNSNETIPQQNAREEKEAKATLEAAKGNRLEVSVEAEKRNYSYTALQNEVAAYLEEQGREPPNIAQDRDKAKAAVDEIKADLAEAKKDYSTALESYKKALEKNGADGADVEVQHEGIRADIEIANGNLEMLKEFRDQAITRHKNFAARYKEEKTPNLKTEVEVQRKRYEVTKKEIEDLKKEIKGLEIQLSDGDLPDRADDEDSDDGLFVPEGDGSVSDPVNLTSDVLPPVLPPVWPPVLPRVNLTPKINITDADDEDPTIDPEDIWSPALARKRAGLGKDVFRIEGYRDGRPAKVVTGRGPPNASSFRLENESDYPVDRLKDKNITENRIGDEKSSDKKWVYGKQNLPVIQGVALPPNNSVQSVEPIPKVAYGMFQRRAIPIAIKVKWWVDGAYVKCWETRSTIRRVFGKGQGDIAIYEAAVFQEKRYEEWLSGDRGNTGRSPSVQPPSSQLHVELSDDDDGDDNGDDELEDGGEVEIKQEVQEAGPVKTTKAGPVKTTKAAPVKRTKAAPVKTTKAVPVKTTKAILETTLSPMDIFEARWCKRRNIDPANMSDEDDMQFMRDWQKLQTA